MNDMHMVLKIVAVLGIITSLVEGDHALLTACDEKPTRPDPTGPWSTRAKHWWWKRPSLAQSCNQCYLNIFKYIHTYVHTEKERERDRDGDIDIDRCRYRCKHICRYWYWYRYTNKDLSTTAVSAMTAIYKTTAPAMKPRLKDATQSSDRGSQGEHGSTILNSPPLSKSKASPASLQTISQSSFSQVWHT